MKLQTIITSALSVCLGFTAMAISPVRADTLTARVHIVDGVPRLVVNGKPMRPRIFWGGPGSAPLHIRAGRQKLSFTFSPMLSEPAKATLHFRFTHRTSKILIESVHLHDLTSGTDVIPQTTMGAPGAFAANWSFWPSNSSDPSGEVDVLPSDANGNGGGAQISMHEPTHGTEWGDTHIFHNANLAIYRDHSYQLDVTLTSDTPTDASINLYKPGNTYTFLGSVQKDVFEDQIKLAAGSDVNIVSFWMQLPWPKPDEQPNYESADTLCDYVLKANPKALILPRIYMQTPDWWLSQHPDDRMRWDRQAGHPHTATVSSIPFRVDGGAKLSDLIHHLEAKFGSHMLGYHVAGQNTDEWFYQDSWGPDWNGYAPADSVAWIKWLVHRYSTDAALQTAWNRTDVTLASASVPTPEERKAAQTELVDPTAQRNVLDWNCFQQENMTDTVLHFAHVVREATHSVKISVFFYGYLYEFAGMQNGVANAGHYALHRLLDSPDIDCLTSPLSYSDRGLTGSGPLMSAVDSDALAGKLYIAEDDTATNLSQGDAPGSDVRNTNADDTNKVLLRSSAQVALRNLGTWWMDLGHAGWFDDPAYWNMLDRFSPVERDMLKDAHPFHPQIASVVDEDSVQWTAYHNRLGGIMYSSRLAFGRVGAPYGQYLQRDVLAGRVHAKLYAFLTSWGLNAEQRATLLTQTRGATRVWCYAPGYYDGYTPSLPAMHQLTSFQFKTLSGVDAWASPTAAGSKLGLLPAGFGLHAPLRPTFAVTDAAPGEALATYPDGSVAVAIRKTSSGVSIFCGAPYISTELARIAAHAAGVHLYTKTDATVFANGPFLAVHATAAGPITIDTGAPSAITDAMTGKTVGHGPRLTLPFELGDTHVYRY